MSRRAWLCLSADGRVRAASAEEPSPEWRISATLDGDTFMEMVPAYELADAHAENERLRAVNPWTQTNVDARWAMHHAETAWITAWDAEWRHQRALRAADTLFGGGALELRAENERLSAALEEACALLAAIWDEDFYASLVPGRAEGLSWLDERDAFLARWGRK